MQIFGDPIFFLLYIIGGPVYNLAENLKKENAVYKTTEETRKNIENQQEAWTGNQDGGEQHRIRSMTIRFISEGYKMEFLGIPKERQSQFYIHLFVYYPVAGLC